MQLQFVSIARLIIDAGGDPGAINDSLQAGRPGPDIRSGAGVS